MSRKKYQVVKLLEDANTIGKFTLCDTGELSVRYNPKDVEFVMDLQTLAIDPPLDLCKNEQQRATMLKSYESGKAEYADKLLNLYLNAFKTRNAEKIASLAEATKIVCASPVSPEYSWLLTFLSFHSPKEAFASKKHRVANVVFSELSKAYSKMFGEIKEPQLREMVKSLGWKIKEVKRGPHGKRVITNNKPL